MNNETKAQAVGVDYNTHRTRLVMPEYGRCVQQMVEHAKTIADRGERQRCAHTIVGIMANMGHQHGDMESFQQKLWNHLAFMSGYELDIDYPVEISGADRHPKQPEPVSYPGRYMRYRHYGHTVEEAIERAIDLPDGPEKDELILLVANHMKKLLMAVNKDGVTDDKIARDLAELSHGMIRLDPAITPLHEFNIIAPPSRKKKRKR